jgi:uncharacterized protein YcnI
MPRLFTPAVLAAASLAALASPAFAHISLETPGAAIGSAYKAVLRVPHGCDGNPTTAITLKVPEGLVSAKPMPKAGWSLAIKSGDYARSYTLHGSTVTAGAIEISWSGGNLPDTQYDEFVVRGTLARSLVPGETLYFPVIQTCTTGEEDWIDTSGSEDGTPAPALKLLPAAGGGN